MQERHYGLCASRDHVVYHAALDVARKIERHVTAEDVGRYLQIKKNADKYLCVYLAHYRARRPRAQQTHVFLSCEDDDAIVLWPRIKDDELQYLSVWMIAKALLMGDECNRLAIRRAVHRRRLGDGEDGSVVEVINWEAEVQILPVGPAIPRPRADPALRALAEPSRSLGHECGPRLAASGGVSGYVGAASSGGLPASGGVSGSVGAAGSGGAVLLPELYEEVRESDFSSDDAEEAPLPPHLVAPSSAWRRQHSPEGPRAPPPVQPQYGNGGDTTLGAELVDECVSAACAAGDHDSAERGDVEEGKEEEAQRDEEVEEEEEEADEAEEVNQQAEMEEANLQAEEEEPNQPAEEEEASQLAEVEEANQRAEVDEQHAVAVEAPRTSDGWARGSEVRLRYEGYVIPCTLGGNPRGIIKINVNAGSLDAHCAVCKCKVNRRYGPRVTGTGAQGRPLGMHIAWLQFPCSGNSAAHRAQLQHLTFHDRLQARTWAAQLPELEVLFSWERPRRPDEDADEPRDLC